MTRPDHYEVVQLTDDRFVIRILTWDSNTLTPGAGTIYVHTRKK